MFLLFQSADVAMIEKPFAAMALGEGKKGPSAELAVLTPHVRLVS